MRLSDTIKALLQRRSRQRTPPLTDAAGRPRPTARQARDWAVQAPQSVLPRNAAARGGGLDDEIGRHLADSERRGELRAARFYGQPLPEDTGWQQTPEALRMGFKILHDAGVVPHEVELMQQSAALRQQLQATTDPAAADALRARLAGLEQRLALRLEALARHR